MSDTLTTLTRADLARMLSERIGLNQQESFGIIDALFDEIGEALVAGAHVRVWGFGRFVLRDKPARPGRNPRTGSPAVVPARRVVTFRPGVTLRRRLRGDDG